MSLQSKHQYFVVPILVSLLAWVIVFGFSVWQSKAAGAAYTSVSDTLSDSDLGAPSNHTVAFTAVTSTTGTAGAEYVVKITFDPSTNMFDRVGSTTISNVSTTGMTLTPACSVAASEVTLVTSTAAGDESIAFDVCDTDTIATGTKSILIGNTVLTNPTSTNSYIIRLTGATHDQTDTRVAILSDVLLTASVDTSFVFTVLTAPTGTLVNNVT